MVYNNFEDRYIPPSTISLHERNDDQAVLVPNNTPNPVTTGDAEVASDNESVINYESVVNIEVSQCENSLSQGEGLNVKAEQAVVVDVEEEPCASCETLDLK